MKIPILILRGPHRDFLKIVEAVRWEHDRGGEGSVPRSPPYLLT